MRRLLSIVLFSTLGTTVPDAQQNPLLDELIAVERAAIDRWIHGDPGGFLALYEPELTYFDPSLDRRIDNLPAMRAYVSSVEFPVVKDVRYDIVTPAVQRHGDIAILTFRTNNYGRVGDKPEAVLARWNVTEVYRRVGSRWRIIHSHFSYTKPESKPMR